MKSIIFCNHNCQTDVKIVYNFFLKKFESLKNNRRTHLYHSILIWSTLHLEGQAVRGDGCASAASQPWLRISTSCLVKAATHARLPACCAQIRTLRWVKWHKVLGCLHTGCYHQLDNLCLPLEVRGTYVHFCWLYACVWSRTRKPDDAETKEGGKHSLALVWLVLQNVRIILWPLWEASTMEKHTFYQKCQMTSCIHV